MTIYKAFIIRAKALFFGFLLLCSCSVLSVEYSVQETALIGSFGPWPPEIKADTSNRFSQQKDAVELGRQLFFDRRLSSNNQFSCADCHQPNKAFQDGLALNEGFNPLHRNTSSLLNLANRPWYGWGGEHDSLWSQSIRPMLAEAEMRTDITQLKSDLTQDKYFQCAFQQTIKQSIDDLDDETFLITLGKLLASYQETIQTGKSEFDLFRDQLIEKTPYDKTTLSESAQKGLKTFIGEGRCVFCHSGPHFSNGEFGDIGVPFFTSEGVDKGRYNGIKALRKDPYNLLGQYNDAVTLDHTIPDNAQRTSHLQLLHRNWGEFKVPSLRNVAQTAPYMHNGSVDHLRAVIDFYSELDEERLHADGEKILRPLNLTPEEKDDLQAFLVSLSGPISVAQEDNTIFDHCLTIY